MRIFVALLVLLLVGYMAMGRGFAHIGAGPIYVGEVVLAIGLLVTAYALIRLGLRPLRSVTVGLLLLFMIWGAARTIPYVTTYGIDAFRDAVLWGYAVFALMLYLLADRAWIRGALRAYGLIVPLFALWLPIAYLIWLEVSKDVTTDRPAAIIPLVYYKAGDMAAHSVGSIGFLVLLSGAWAQWRTFAWRYALSQSFVWTMFISGTGSRGALIAALSGIGLLLVATKRFRNWLPVALATVVLTLALTVGPLLTSAIQATIANIVTPSTAIQPGSTVEPGESPPARWFDANRPATLDTLVSNFTSTLTDSGDENQVGTKRFRIEWWTAIVNYTVFGPYLMTGKGFGVNLADADGFQPTLDHSLRAPHNSTMTVLARMGVPGFLLWVALLAAWAFGVLRAFVRSRRAGDRWLAAVSAWLFVYWFAMMLVTSFDPYIEGPQGGIWFWTVFGLGLVATRLAPEPGTDDRTPLLGEAGWRDSLRSFLPSHGGQPSAPRQGEDGPVPQAG